jgi:dTDP-4-amino-4,6-dideoxygalactose transaminase
MNVADQSQFSLGNSSEVPVHIESHPGVPLLDLARQHTQIKDQIQAALNRVCQSGAFILGPEVTQLERGVAAYSQAAHGVGCASGSDALLLALMALEIGPRDEVILPSFTFFATASAVTRLGARPIFADIDPETYNIDAVEVEKLITSKTKAIVPVHLFGQMANMDALEQIAATRGIPLVEDAAQAIGAEWNGRRAGSIGAIGCFSFYPTKNLGGAGDGGMLTTHSDEIADRLRLLRTHGMRPRYYHSCVGINSRLDSLQAAILNVKLPFLDHWSALRKANADRYSEMFTAVGLDRVLGLPKTSHGCKHVWNQYVVRVPGGQRNALREALASARIGTEVYYPLGLHQQECYGYLGYEADDLPETRRATEEVLALPIYPELRADEQRIVVDQIAAFFSDRPKNHALRGPNYLKQQAARSRQ